MPIATLPTQDLLTAVGQIPGLDLLLWDLRTPPPVADIDLVVCNYPQTADDRPALSWPERIGTVQVLSAGYDHVRGALPSMAQLANGKGIHTTATAEAALSLMLASQRELPRMFAAQEHQHWEWNDVAPPGLADRRVAILGYGDIGHAIAQRLVACEALPTGFARSARPGDGLVDAVLPLSEFSSHADTFDIVCLVMPLSEATYHLVDTAFLAQLKDGALVVNVGRGGLVDTDALVAELSTRRLRAALDVTEPEPLPDGHPLWNAPGCLIFPHVGGHSQAQFPRVQRFLCDQLGRLARGETLRNLITD
ncbi:MAG: NAD(P)-dependent oxidoreductase [Propionibacteriaceae bacterium]